MANIMFSTGKSLRTSAQAQSGSISLEAIRACVTKQVEKPHSNVEGQCKVAVEATHIIRNELVHLRNLQIEEYVLSLL